MTQFKHRSVAVCFIFHFPNSIDHHDTGPKVALFKRSARVRTYQHKYAPISGSVEPSDASPLATAWRELHEETGLTSSSLTLLRQGKPYSFADESIQRAWTINPFAFRLTCDPSAIQIDWEHDSYAWFDPRRVGNDDPAVPGVPRLLESLRRVWFALDLGDAAASILADGLARLQRDHERGARQLAGVALRVFIDVLRALDAVDETAWWVNAPRVAWHLWKNGRETMGAPILSLLLASLDVVRRQTGDAGAAVVARLEHLAREREGDSSTAKVAGALAALLRAYPEDEPVRLVTLSASSTVGACLEHALTTLPHRLDVRVLESRPLCEGAGMARRLAAFAAEHDVVSRMDVTVFTDAAAGVAARGADLLLLGADLIDRQGNVSNKTGSLPAVLAARHVSRTVKVVVVSEKEKVLPFEPPGHEENDGSEVTAAWEAAGVRREDGDGVVKVRNVYFEWVDSGLVDAYVTDEGVSRREDVTRWAEDIERRANDVFDGL